MIRVTKSADDFVRELAKASVSVQQVVDGVTRTYTQLLVTAVQAKASGRPGPNAPTGDYRRSWNARFRRVDGAVQGDAGTNKPQGRRLEFGFNGTDSLGRNYNQQPYPHVWPAAERIFPQYERAVGLALGKLL